MKDKEIIKIMDFIDKTLKDIDIEYQETINFDHIKIEILDMFPNDKISYNFKVINDKLHCSLTDEYMEVDEQLLSYYILSEIQKILMK